MAAYATSRWGTHSAQLQAAVGENILSHCILRKFGAYDISDMGYLAVWDCLLGNAAKQCGPENCMAAIMIDYSLVLADQDVNTVFADIDAVLDGVYGVNRAGTQLGAPFRAMMGAFAAAQLQNAAITALEAAVAALPNPITQGALRAMDHLFIDVLEEPADIWDNVYSRINNNNARGCLIGGIATLCHRGSVTQRHITKIANGVEDLCVLGDVLTRETSSMAYRIMRALFPRPGDIAGLFARLGATFTQQTQLRINLVIQQARNAGVSSVVMGVEALRAAATCPVWGYIKMNAVAEYNAFMLAARRVHNDPYVGFDLFNPIPDAIKSTHYPSMVVAALAILRGLNPQSTTLQYAGRPQTYLSAEIAAIVTAWLQHRAAQALQGQFHEGQPNYADVALDFSGGVAGLDLNNIR